MEKMEVTKVPEWLFIKELLKWNAKSNNRPMPWKGEKDPYKIWLSEIILQQTRVEQGMKYYENFIRTFPNIHSLANAPEEKVLKLWEGLGYYTRCRNLIETSKIISDKHLGVFPKDYTSILQLKGIGPYTAAAISSFAYNSPYAVLDGNVFRVLSRIFGINIHMDTTEGKKIFSSLAQKLLPEKRSAEYNQAIMDFGAVICKPLPLCSECFFAAHCIACQKSMQQILPVKRKKIKLKERWLNYLLIIYNDEILIHQRTKNDIWQGLYEFLLIETQVSLSESDILNEMKKEFSLTFKTQMKLGHSIQKLSHQLVHFNFIKIELQVKSSVNGFKWVRMNDIHKYPFPKTLQQLINSELFSLCR